MTVCSNNTDNKYEITGMSDTDDSGDSGNESVYDGDSCQHHSDSPPSSPHGPADFNWDFVHDSHPDDNQYDISTVANSIGHGHGSEDSA